jgi:molecular chaperone DnaK
MGRIIGIDLGTTNSLIAFMSRRRPRIIKDPRTNSDTTPSVVLYQQGQNWVGQDAKDRSIGARNRVYSIKRLMGIDYNSNQAQKTLRHISYSTRIGENGEVKVKLGNDYLTPTQISAIILEQLKQNAELSLGEPVTHAIITVPAYFNQRQKQATREAGRLAGLEVARILNEPTAAALAYGVELSQEENQQILVYDLGGGTFDVSILMVSSSSGEIFFDVLNYDGDNFLGGDNFDQTIIELLLQHIQEEHKVDLSQNAAVLDLFKRLAEQAKINLTLRKESRIIAEQFYMLNDTPINLDYTLIRSDFERAIEPFVQNTIDIVQIALQGAHLNVDDIDRVLLVGGTTRTPLVRRRLRELFGDRVEYDVEPIQCVALGAAVLAGTLSESGLNDPGDEEDADQLLTPNIVDITAKHLCVEVTGGAAAGKPCLAVVIEKQTSFPMDEPRKHMFYTSYPNQQRYRLPVYEVEANSLSEAESAKPEQWEHVGVVENDRLPPGLPTNTPILVEMLMDSDGILTVASYLKNDRDRSFIEQSFRFFGSEVERLDSLNKDEVAEKLDAVQFHLQMFRILIDDPIFRTYLQNCIYGEIQQYVDEMGSIADSKELEVLENALVRAKRLRADLPVPTEDIFWATVFLQNSPEVSLVDQRQIQQLLRSMERTMGNDDMDGANEALAQLRRTLQEVISRTPTHGHLLRHSRM